MMRSKTNLPKKFPHPEMSGCACFNFRKASRAVTQFFERVMQPTGLRATQFTLLVVIGMAGPTPLSPLSEILVMDRTTLTRDLRRLQRQDLVDVVPGKDRRVRMISLTRRGRQVLEEASPLWEKAQAQIVERLGPTRWERLLSDLSDVVAQAQKG